MIRHGHIVCPKCVNWGPRSFALPLELRFIYFAMFLQLFLYIVYENVTQEGRCTPNSSANIFQSRSLRFTVSKWL
jgi:hypothetical protein